MGCSASRLDDEEAVQLCRDRRNFIKQAVEQRNRFAAGHVVYIQSLRHVSSALRNYVEGDEYRDFFSDSYMAPPFAPVKRLNPEIISVPIKNFSPTLNHSEKTTIHVMKYLRSGGNTSVSVEEWPQLPETVRLDSYYPADNYGVDGFFTSQASPSYTSFFSSPYNRPSYPPPPSQTSQWDNFWNPFSALDSYGYPSGHNLDRITSDDEMAGLRRVREEEGIPELEEDEELGSREEEDEEEEEEEEDEEEFIELELKEKGSSINSSSTGATVDKKDSPKTDIKSETVHEVREFMSQGPGSVGVSEARNAVELEVTNQQQVAGNRGGGEETPGFTVYVNRRPTSIAEVMKDMENQFLRICDCADEISVLLEANRAYCSSTSSDLAVRMLNPVALLRSASLRSSSSRFFLPPSSRDEGSESSSDYSEESCVVSGSHQSTLDRLYTWEKKLYDEVKCGERIRIAYERKCMQLRNQDVNGDEPSAIDRTRAAIRDLHTRLTVSIHSVESISRRIEILRDEELHPQLVELIQGLARMWRTIAECHRVQKRTIDEAKLLFLSSARAAGPMPPPKPSRAAALLESELRGWRAAFEAWAGAQRSYARALADWIRRCAGPSATVGSSPFLTPSRSSLSGGGIGAPPLYGICVRWSRLLESVSEARVVDGLDFFAAGIASVSGGVGVGEEEADLAGERAAELAMRVVWAGMSAVVGALAEFAASSADGYEALTKSGNEGAAGE